METETERRIAQLESAVLQLQQEVLKLLAERRTTLPQFPAPTITPTPPWYQSFEVTSMLKEGA